MDSAEVEKHDIASLARHSAGVGVLESIRRQVRRADSVIRGRDVLNVAPFVTPVQESNLAIFVVGIVQMNEGTGVPQVLVGVKRLILVHCERVCIVSQSAIRGHRKAKADTYWERDGRSRGA